MILSRYVFVGLLLIVAVGFAVAPLLIASLVAPRKASRSKADAYECGMTTTGETWVRFRMQYYLFALLFVVFDVESVFLYPWAVTYGGLGAFALIEMLVFIGMLALGLAYAWGRGVLVWS